MNAKLNCTFLLGFQDLQEFEILILDRVFTPYITSMSTYLATRSLPINLEAARQAPRAWAVTVPMCLTTVVTYNPRRICKSNKHR